MKTRRLIDLDDEDIDLDINFEPSMLRNRQRSLLTIRLPLLIVSSQVNQTQEGAVGFSPTATSDDMVGRLVAEMDRDGYGCLPGYIPSTALEEMRFFVSSAISRSAGEYVGFTGATAVVGSTLDDIAASREFQYLMTRVYECGTGRKAPPVQFYQVLRCLSGATSRKHSLNFHYDSYVVTALIPVEIPTTGRTGDLIMIPNTRKIRRSYTSNLLDKFILDNALTQLLLRSLLRARLLPLTRIKLVPGNIYFFWGYRSIHTNEACDPDKVRATALFHFANPHAESRLKHRLRRQPA